MERAHNPSVEDGELTASRSVQLIDEPVASSITVPASELYVDTGADSGAGLPRRYRLSAEAAIYLLLLALAGLSRFWNLGARALHHDESLHAYFSWLYATGGGYVHDPLMHGPFLFHIEALVFLLFGASDASARYAPALFGTILVGLPYLLRGPRHLGRWGALAASALFLISPAFLYYSRFIRHDIFTVVGTFLLFICIVRYVERPAPRWIIGGGVILACLLANHEIIFAILFIFATYLGLVLLSGSLRPLVPLTIATLLIGAMGLVVIRRAARPLPRIPWDVPTPANQRQFYHQLLTHPLVIFTVLLVIVYLFAAYVTLAAQRDPDRPKAGILETVFGGAEPGSLDAAVYRLWQDKIAVIIALGVGAVIFATLYTSLFSNLHGLATGTYAVNGTLLYWLGQQGVRRGSQPWFYFIILMPQYELFAVLFGGAGLVAAVWQALRAKLGRLPASEKQFFRLFLAFWATLIFLGLSYAGEKMPWLVIHISLPATLLAAGVIGQLIERAIAAWLDPAAPRSRFAWSPVTLTTILVAAGAAWFVIAAHLTYGEFVPSPATGWKHVVTVYARHRWWYLAIPPLIALGALVVSALLRGGQTTARAAIAALMIGLVFLQVHAGWRLSYLDGDVAKDTLIYNTTTPDVTRFVRELGYLSNATTGGKGIDVWYDQDNSVWSTAWPLNWYLRDYTNKHTFTGPQMGPPGGNPAVVVVGKNDEPWVDGQMSNYTRQEYIMRWHEPEYDIYRNFAIAPELGAGFSAWKSQDQPHGWLDILRSIRDSFATQLTPEGQTRVYRLLMYRDLPAGTMNYDFVVYVRNDLVPLLNSYRYGT